ncbi:MAG: N-acetylgalactosamine-6-sulfatase [Acidobacteria bacterium]|nr:N-acetylgalactosamine-6-sulfatase [Acidobacteriota bacterium]
MRLFPYKTIAAAAVVLNAACQISPGPAKPTEELRPNIIYIYADDLGYNEVGSYGQAKIRTPNLDRLAAEGIRFTQHYSGSAVCAPSRSVLLTGKHTGHAYIRNNKELGGWGPDEPEGQWPLAAEETTLAEILQQHGYATGAMGKWGLGGPDAHGQPNLQGFDHFYGYLCQRVAHNYYPTHLWRNGEKDMLTGNEYFDAHQRIEAPFQDPADYERFKGTTYAPDAIANEALQFIRDHAKEPFFLYYPTIVPHVALQVPTDSLAEYAGIFEDPPYLGDESYLPHPEPRAAYAAMITRMDRNVGRILDLIVELDIDNDTIVMFSSDNGPTWVGGSDLEFFDGNGPFRGRKQQLFEGGIRVPMIARWPGVIGAGKVTDHLSAQWDVLPTVLELVGASETIPADIDGISFAPTLLAEGAQPAHDVMYWELGRQQAVRAGSWKLYRSGNADGEIDIVELFNLHDDPSEENNLAAEQLDVLNELLELAQRSRTPSTLFPSVFDSETGVVPGGEPLR